MPRIIEKPLPEEWGEVHEVIRRLHTLNAHPVVFGGCLRDRLYGESPKDIDVAISVTDYAQVQCLGASSYYQHLGDRENRSRNIRKLFARAGVGDLQYMCAFLVESMPAAVELFVFSSPPEAQKLAAFSSFGISQIATDGMKLYVTQAFEQDHRDRRIVMRGRGLGFAYDGSYVARLQDRLHKQGLSFNRTSLLCPWLFAR